MRFFKKGLFFLGLGSVSFVYGNFSFYEKTFNKKDLEKKRTIPIVLSAHNCDYDQAKGVFTAQGGVCLRQQGSVLYADKLIYREKNQEIEACGNVSLKEEGGEVVFCERAFLRRDLHSGHLIKARLLSRMDERITALRIDKTLDHKKTMEMGSYTPCKKCEDKLSPVWSLHGRHIVHDETEHKLHYTDAHLEFLGVPVLYLPYFYLPTQRKSGVLFPYLSMTRELGGYVGVPYYWAINKNKDLMLTPFITTKGGTILAPEYRHRLEQGKLLVRGALNTPLSQQQASQWRRESVTKSGVRGYLHGDFAYDLNRHWRLRSHEWWTSDKTFLTTRPFFGKTTDAYLESQTKLEGFYQNHYCRMRGIHYQGLQESDRSRTTPLVYPEIDYFYDSPPLGDESVVSVHLNTLSLYKPLGNAEQRGVIEGEWARPIVNSLGQQWNFFTRVQAGVYATKIQEAIEHSPKKNYKIGRCFPQAGVEWSWAQLSRNGKWFFTPIVQLIGAPPRLNTEKIPNEDSQFIAFSDANLFSKSRFAGFDRIDQGSRATYGTQWGHEFGPKHRTSFFVGQSYAFSRPDELLAPVGIRRHFSDVVGKAEVSVPYVVMFYRFRCDNKRLSMRVQEIGWDLGSPKFLVTGSYAFSRQKSMSPVFLTYNQLFLNVSSQLTQYWKGKVFITQDFKKGHTKQNMLDKGVGIAYQDECFEAGVTVQHSRYRMRDLKPGYSVDFYISLKNLGGFVHKQQRFSRGV
jgi:LPS-assembly protein